MLKLARVRAASLVALTSLRGCIASMPATLGARLPINYICLLNFTKLAKNEMPPLLAFLKESLRRSFCGQCRGSWWGRVLVRSLQPVEACDDHTRRVVVTASILW